MALLDSLLARSESEIVPEERLQMLVRAASRRVSLGQPRESEAASREAIALAASLRDSAGVRVALRWLSVAVSTQGRAEEARAVCLRLLELSQAARDRRHEGWALVGLGWSSFNAGNTAEAERQFARAASLFEELEEHEGIAWAQNAWGTALARLSDYAKAREAYARAARMAEEIGFRMVEAMALNNLASLEFSLGDPGIALERFARAGELQRQVGNRRESIIPALNVAICQIELGRYDEAEENLSRQLNECRDNGYDDLQGDVLYMRSELLRARAQRHAAAATLRQALALGASLNLRTQVECLMGLSDVLAEMDSSQAAFEIIETSSRALHDRPLGQIGSRMALARADRLLALQRPAEALAALGDAFALDSTPPTGSQQTDALLIEALVLAAQAQRERGNRDQALATLYRAAGLWERQRGAPLDPEWREQRGRTGERLYSSIAALLLADRGKDPTGDVVREVFDRLQQFKARTLEERMQGPLGAVSLAERPPLAGLDELQAGLQPGDLFLDFHVGREFTVLIAVTPRDRRIVRLPPAEDWNATVRGLLDLMSAPPSPGGLDQETLRRVSRELYAAIFGPVEDLIDESRRMVVAPDGVLTMAPFSFMHLARVAEKGNAEQVPKQWVRTPSAQIWLRLMQRPPQAGEQPATLAVAGRGSGDGAALRGTVAEVRGLSRRYRGVTARIPGPRAALAASDLEGYDLLHLACHLILDEQRPWQSRFPFAPAESVAALRAAEIAERRIPAGLVFLASCSSAGGRIVSGEGVLGVSSAFLSAGASSIIATLWPVDDQVTTRLVEHFYAQLARGADVGSALAYAQQVVAREPATSHPFYWAGFVLIGDPGTRIALQARSPSMGLTSGAALLLAGGAGAWLYRRRTRDRAPRRRPACPQTPRLSL